jgi:hypothetical protein
MADDGKWTIETAKASLLRNGADIKGKQITMKRAGIRVWGAIDYLINKHKFSFFKEENNA